MYGLRPSPTEMMPGADKQLFSTTGSKYKPVRYIDIIDKYIHIHT